MNTNGFLRKHWFHVTIHFLCDAFLFVAALLAAIELRFGEEAQPTIGLVWSFVLMGSVLLASANYIAGLYSTHSSNMGLFKRALVLMGCLAFSMALLLALTYLDNARPLGRGIVLIGASTCYVSLLLHHWYLLSQLRNSRERVAYVVSCSFDEAETRLFRSFGGHHLEFVGLVLHNGYAAKSEVRVLGASKDLARIVAEQRIDRILCTTKSLKDKALSKLFCQLRYSGINVLPLISLCEEVDQFVPLELVSSEWLLNASGEPHMLYIKKIKRLFDVVISAVLLILFSPVLLLGMLAVKLSSPGPIFYRQVRSGRFGKQFTIYKLRTMRADAEKDGAVWWGGKDDLRVTLPGGFMRKYRIDEIPQLVNVFQGDMSFVGPRPERPEMIDTLAKEVPFYQERQMVQPGLTGWAQVNYPYGASAEDAGRKLEYDLYYMKNMSLYLDVFILLDTVRIILCGGVADDPTRRTSRSEAVNEWERLKLEEAETDEDLTLAAQ